MRLKVCLNGARQRDAHPSVPGTPAELATAARDAVAAGAEAVHLHPRAAGGSESLLAGDVGVAVATVRDHCPGVPVGVSTGLWITAGDVSRRQLEVAGWAALAPRARPDFASVNLSEPGADDLLAALAGTGIAAEAGVWSVADARVLAGTLRAGVTWLRVLVEILDVPAGQAVAVADEVLTAVRGSAGPPGLPVLLHGAEDACWPLVRHAGRLGLATRIGLEDTLSGPDGAQVRDNAHLVALGAAVWTAGRAEPGSRPEPGSASAPPA